MLVFQLLQHLFAGYRLTCLSLCGLVDDFEIVEEYDEPDPEPVEQFRKAIRVRMILREDAPLQKEKLAMVKVTEDRLRSHIAMDIETDPEEI